MQVETSAIQPEVRSLHAQRGGPSLREKGQGCPSRVPSPHHPELPASLLQGAASGPSHAAGLPPSLKILDYLTTVATRGDSSIRM